MPRRTESKDQWLQSRLHRQRHRNGRQLNAGGGRITHVALVLTRMARLWMVLVWLALLRMARLWMVLLWLALLQLVSLQTALAPPRRWRWRARIVLCTAMTRVGQGWGHKYQSCRDLLRGAGKPDPIPSTQSCRHSRNSTSPFRRPPRGLLRSLRHRPPSERTQGRCSNRSQWRFLRLAHLALLELQEPASFGRRGNS